MNNYFPEFFKCANCLRRDTKDCPFARFNFHPITNVLVGYKSEVDDNFFCKNFKGEEFEMNVDKYSDVATDLMLTRAEVSYLRKLYKQIANFKELHKGEDVYLVTGNQLEEIISTAYQGSDCVEEVSKLEVLE